MITVRHSITGLAVALLLTLGACSSPETRTAPPAVVVGSASTTPSPLVVPSPTTASAKPTAAVLGIGQSLVFEGAKVTVVEVTAKPQGYHSLPLVGALVQVCNTSTDKTFTTSPRPWSLATSDGSLFKNASSSWENDPVPLYPWDGVITAGQCIKGWLLFEVPSGTTLTEVRYATILNDDTPITGTWKV